ncbi:MAG TPA: HAD hydrolase-like protein [Candidatus Cloacimonadota bacterium]|nr:HAD hydrolase-like protein [Candidatus Cloacimonadota bacterium]
MKPFLLFDFDGTIANSIGLIYDILNRLAPRFGLEPVSIEDFEVLRSMSPPTLLRMAGIPFYKIPLVIHLVLKEYRKQVHELHPYPGIEEMLSALDRTGVRTALLSSNTKRNVTDFLARHHITGFEWVEGTSGVMNKRGRINRMIRKHKLDPGNVIYIGDESRDIEAAKQCGIRVISVTWGFHAESLLNRYKPDYIVQNPAEIVDLIKN